MVRTALNFNKHQIVQVILMACGCRYYKDANMEQSMVVCYQSRGVFICSYMYWCHSSRDGVILFWIAERCVQLCTTMTQSFIQHGLSVLRIRQASEWNNIEASASNDGPLEHLVALNRVDTSICFSILHHHVWGGVSIECVPLLYGTTIITIVSTCGSCLCMMLFAISLQNSLVDAQNAWCSVIIMTIVVFIIRLLARGSSCRSCQYKRRVR